MRTLIRQWIGSFAADHAPPVDHEPLDITVQRARLLLMRACEAGREVDDETLSSILTTEQAGKSGELSADDQRTFYKSYAKLVQLTADISKRSETAEEFPFEDAVDDSEQLLKYASEAGAAVLPETLDGILAARTALTLNAVSDQTRAAFYAAYAGLAKQFGQITAETIRNCASAKTRRALARDRIVAVALTAAVASISVATFVADSISKQIVENVASANDAAAKLRAGLVPAASSPPIDERYSREDPCTLIDEPPVQSSPQVQSVEAVTQIQQFAATIRELRGRSIKLNKFLSTAVFHELECDPYGTCEDQAHNAKIPKEEQLNRMIQVKPAIANYTAEVLCKIQTYQLIRTFATNVQSDYTVMIGAVVSYALPILYALLGAYAYRLRLFADTIRRRTYHPSFADSARMITAVIAGAIAGLFNPAQGLALSPLATAFLIGYGVELFFRFLDNLLNAFGKPAGPSKSAG